MLLDGWWFEPPLTSPTQRSFWPVTTRPPVGIRQFRGLDIIFVESLRQTNIRRKGWIYQSLAAPGNWYIKERFMLTHLAFTVVTETVIKASKWTVGGERQQGELAVRPSGHLWKMWQLRWEQLPVQICLLAKLIMSLNGHGRKSKPCNHASR